MARQIGLAVGLLLIASLFAFDQPCSAVVLPFPETVILGAVPQPIPNLAAEIAAIEQFPGRNITVVDPIHIKSLRRTDPKELPRTGWGQGRLSAGPVRRCEERVLCTVAQDLHAYAPHVRGPPV